MIVDAHAHLDDPKFDHDRQDVIERAWENYVRLILTVHCDADTSRWGLTQKMLGEYDFIFGAVGLHPHEAKRFDDRVIDFLHASWQNPKVIGIGETGLDFYYMHSPKEDQIRVFEWHIHQAKVHHKPLIIHTRDAHEETLEILKNEHADEIGGMIHCFTGNTEHAKQYLELNFYISFSGIVTFPNAKDIQDAARYVPLDRILVETDCPYLAPVPYRGRRNEPAYVLKVAEFIAKLKNMNIGDVKSAIFQNFFALFSIPHHEFSLPERS